MQYYQRNCKCCDSSNRRKSLKFPIQQLKMYRIVQKFRAGNVLELMECGVQKEEDEKMMVEGRRFL